jgi:hypothetical protein
MGPCDSYRCMERRTESSAIGNYSLPYQTEHKLYELGKDSMISAKAYSAIAEQQMFRARYLQ